VKNRNRHFGKLQKSDPLSKLSPAEVRRYAPTPDDYYELMGQVTVAIGQALGVGDMEYDSEAEALRYRREHPDKTLLLDLWNNNPLARAFIEAMIAVQPKIKGLIEEETQ